MRPASTPIAASELRVDKELNKAAYGLEVGPQELLSTLGQGGAPAPAQFAAVYDKLNEVSMQSVWVDGRWGAVQGTAGQAGLACVWDCN